MTDGKLIRSTGIIGCATTLSRMLGFIRDIFFAKLFGTNIFAQAFVVAFRLPNMFRDMVGEGATDAALVPILTEYRHTRSEEEYWETARVVLNVLLIVVTVFSVLGILFTPIIIRVIAPGFTNSPEMFSTTVFLTRCMFPYIIFLGIVAYSKGVLNSLHYFTTPALAPVILNISMIAALTLLCPVMGVQGLVIGVLAGGFLEVAIQMPQLVKKGLKFNKAFRIVHPVVGRIGRLLVPRMLGTAVYQLSMLVDTVMASFSWIVGSGGVAALYYSNRLVQLPLAVFGISLATAVLPKMSKEVASSDIGKMKDTVAFSLRTVFTVMAPATAGLMILSGPIVMILFQRGEFTEYSTAITVKALIFYSIGLFAYGGIKILVNAYYSLGDTRTPVRTASISLLVNVALNLILMWPLKIGGLALATSIAAMCNFFILYVDLSKRIGDIGTKGLVASFTRILAATGVMSVCAFVCLKIFLYPAVQSDVVMAFRLVFVVSCGLAAYLLSGYFIGISGIRRMWGIAAEKFDKARKR